ncbi:ATP-binding protein, partial [Enterococcus faecalis]|uniref:ATP-binding protein n=5 Tax=Bacteria TaxID=2 RepID=UPI003984FB48
MMATQATIDFDAGLPKDEPQFLLTRIQLQNWGTFSGRYSIDVPAEGMLLTGNSGSGKSTILDAHAALMTR